MRILLLFVAYLVVVQAQGPPFEPPPRGFVDGARCDRTCSGASAKCFFHFRIETQYTLSKACYNCPSAFRDCFRPDCIIGGGVRRTVTTINRQIPGPPIRVCYGDTIRVLVENMEETGQATTIHWHGMHLRREQYMDGVPFVTQCPILSNNNFTYTFDADIVGTHWYHSHVEVQRGDGVLGELIVKPLPYQNNYANRYNSVEHSIILFDWNDRPRMDIFQAFAKAGVFMEPTGILINGYGDMTNNNVSGTPRANFVVQSGSTYRFRLINANFFNCPVELSIDNHKLIVISTDGQDVAETHVDSIVSNSGERFDFLLVANQPVNTYWIRVKGLLLCERLNTFQLATLTYSGSNRNIGSGRPTYGTAGSTAPNRIMLNPLSTRNMGNIVTIDQLRSIHEIEYGLDTDYVRRFFISLDMSGIDHPANHRRGAYGFNDVHSDMRARTPQLNHLSFKAPAFPLMPNRYNLTSKDFCTFESMRERNCEREYCECTHVLKVKLDEVVELIIFDEMNQPNTPAIHPIHLHGFNFRVLSWGEIGMNLTRPMFERDHWYILRNFERPPLKDTISVPRGGATIVRFKADNPGFWFFHCHIDVHATEGMELVFKVGNNNQMPDKPDNFPTCYNWPK